MKLNGWRRLWIVGAVLWAVYIAALTADKIPTKESLDSELKSRLDYYNTPRLDLSSRVTGKPSSSVETPEEKEERQTKISKAYSRYTQDVKELPDEQKRIATQGVLAATVPPIAFYLFCWLCVVLFRWVRVGFTRTGQ